MKLLLLKLKTGEEILGEQVFSELAEVQTETFSTIVLRKPMAVAPMMMPNQPPKVGLTPWFLGQTDMRCDCVTTFPKDMVLGSTPDVTEAMQDAYAKTTAAVNIVRVPNLGRLT